MNARPLCWLLCLAVAVAAQAGGPAQEPPKAPEVAVVRPAVREVTDSQEFTGHTEAASTVDLRARVSGFILKTPFREGADVQKGDLLFVIDPRPYQAKLEQAEAVLALAEVRSRRAEAEFKRAKTLIARGVMSREEFDRIANGRVEAEAEIRVAKAGLTEARLTLDFTQVRAPISGRIGRRLLDPGNLARQDDTLLGTLVSLDPMYVYWDMDEATYLRLRLAVRDGKLKGPADKVPVFLKVANEAAFAHKGAIDFIDNRVNPTTGTLRIRAVFPNPPAARGGAQLLPGLFVRVRLPIGEPHKAVLVPDKAVITDQGEKFLYVVNAKDVVEQRKVQLGSLHGTWRVVGSGLQPGERVVIAGLQRVRPGMAVRPKQVALPGPEAAPAP